MNFYSTKNKNNIVDFRTAVMTGLANDGGLYMPEFIPKLSSKFISDLQQYTFQEISFNIAEKFIGDEISKSELKDIIDEAINFSAPLIRLGENLFLLELFHGPTLAFKDFGARFMAKIMSRFLIDSDSELNILVATSGDTGSAVANGFYNTPGINVFVLYPQNNISEIQEKQITALGRNITSLKIEGTFDDCQNLVKQAFLDKDINDKKLLSSANSINIARLIPQTFYYFEAMKQLPNMNEQVSFSIPSGNLGNLSASVITNLLGLPIKQLIAATNSNDIFTQYINTGKFVPRKSVRTHSNAMDVGNPSNVNRIDDRFKYDINSIRERIFSKSFSDEETINGIKEVHKLCNYIIDPHGAVGYLAAKDYIKLSKASEPVIILETAHPAKFCEIVETTLNKKIKIPSRLEKCLSLKKQSIRLSNQFDEFKNFLLT